MNLLSLNLNFISPFITFVYIFLNHMNYLSDKLTCQNRSSAHHDHEKIFFSQIKFYSSQRIDDKKLYIKILKCFTCSKKLMRYSNFNFQKNMKIDLKYCQLLKL